MGWIRDWKTRRAQRQAAEAAATAAAAIQAALSEWKRGQDEVETQLAIAESIQSGADRTTSMVMTAHGEVVVWTGAAGLHEPRRGPSQFVAGSQGVSIPLGHTGVRYRVGAVKGTSVPGPDVDATIDVGLATLTSERLIFTGDKVTREWDFDKWVGAECDESEQRFMFHVSNRQKPSGLVFAGDGRSFNQAIGVILAIKKHGLETVLVDCRDNVAEQLLLKPALVQADPPRQT